MSGMYQIFTPHDKRQAANPYTEFMNLSDPISTVVKELGSNLLEQAKQNAEKLGGDDAEALHDFRVSVRRLRSFLKSYENHVKNAKKHRQRLSSIMDLTNSGRDFEVHVAWLNDKQGTASTLEQEGIAYLLEHLTSQEHVDLKKVKKDFDEAAKKMTRVFPQDDGDIQQDSDTRQDKSDVQTKEKENKNSKTFASVTAKVLQDYSEELRSLLEAIKSLDDEVIHDARIAGKRLRYTLELLGQDEAKTLVKALKKLQDATGDLHDLQVLEPKVQTFLFAETVLWSQAFRDGSKTLSHDELSHLPELGRSYALAAVQGRLEAEKTSLYATLENNWLGVKSEDFFSDLQAIIQQLASEVNKTPAKETKRAARKSTAKSKTNKSKTSKPRTKSGQRQTTKRTA
jgi:CHAD domain-containing protein